MSKSTPDQIRARFDADVERFSNLETGQSAFIDSPLCLDLVASAAAALHPEATSVLDLGCGAGNYTLKLLDALAPRDPSPAIACTLVDLSRPMLDRAHQRVSARTSGTVTTLQGDMRALELGTGRYDIAMAAATLHHLRTDAEWEAMFQKIFAALKPGGSFWIVDIVLHTHPGVETLMTARYGRYLSALKGGGAAGEAYRDTVFAYIEAEDTPRPLVYQLELLRQVGFTAVDILHKHVSSAAFGAIKPA